MMLKEPGLGYEDLDKMVKAPVPLEFIIGEFYRHCVTEITEKKNHVGFHEYWLGQR